MPSKLDPHQVTKEGRLCAQVVGFSLHAAVYCRPWERTKLEMLCRYVARPAVAEERFELQASGDIILRLKTPYTDGTTHLHFSGVEFVEKLAAEPYAIKSILTYLGVPDKPPEQGSPNPTRLTGFF